MLLRIIERKANPGEGATNRAHHEREANEGEEKTRRRKSRDGGHA
tara:strand:- start:263 stop:397 length:135 start_codon:yes stop_codon:yes gene_type:complete